MASIGYIGGYRRIWHLIESPVTSSIIISSLTSALAATAELRLIHVRKVVQQVCKK